MHWFFRNQKTEQTIFKDWPVENFQGNYEDSKWAERII